MKGKEIGASREGGCPEAQATYTLVTCSALRGSLSLTLMLETSRRALLVCSVGLRRHQTIDCKEASKNAKNASSSLASSSNYHRLCSYARGHCPEADARRGRHAGNSRRCSCPEKGYMETVCCSIRRCVKVGSSEALQKRAKCLINDKLASWVESVCCRERDRARLGGRRC